MTAMLSAIAVLLQFVWIVHVDVICLSHQGNLLDTCSLATVAALKNSKENALLLIVVLLGFEMHSHHALSF